MDCGEFRTAPRWLCSGVGMRVDNTHVLHAVAACADSPSILRLLPFLLLDMGALQSVTDARHPDTGRTLHAARDDAGRGAWELRQLERH
jgi:hypothetical protein